MYQNGPSPKRLTRTKKRRAACAARDRVERSTERQVAIRHSLKRNRRVRACRHNTAESKVLECHFIYNDIKSYRQERTSMKIDENQCNGDRPGIFQFMTAADGVDARRFF